MKNPDAITEIRREDFKGTIWPPDAVELPLCGQGDRSQAGTRSWISAIKKYLFLCCVLVNISTDRIKTPVSLMLEDGKTYWIDQVCDGKRAAASNVGGTGIRYTIMVRGQQTYLFEDEDQGEESSQVNGGDKHGISFTLRLGGNRSKSGGGISAAAGCRGGAL